jgi:hypothetical protein
VVKWNKTQLTRVAMKGIQSHPEMVAVGINREGTGVHGFDKGICNVISNCLIITVYLK